MKGLEQLRAATARGESGWCGHPAPALGAHCARLQPQARWRALVRWCQVLQDALGRAPGSSTSLLPRELGSWAGSGRPVAAPAPGTPPLPSFSGTAQRSPRLVVTPQEPLLRAKPLTNSHLPPKNTKKHQMLLAAPAALKSPISSQCRGLAGRVLRPE